MFAHRGYTHGFRENTLEAFAEARQRGADGVELDVRRSADGALVVHHDAEIEGVGTVCELGVRDLPGYVPLLEEALEACDGMTVNVEIKNHPGDPGFEPDQAVAAEVAAAVREGGWAEQVLVSSFNLETVRAVRTADPQLPVGWLLDVGADPLAALPEAVASGMSALHPFVLGVTAELVARAHGAGLDVNTWTVNDRRDMAAMVALGVDGIITDRLEDALAAARPS